MTEDRLPELWERAAGLDEAGRAELLASLRREEPELAGELERMLAAARLEPGSPLDRPARLALGGETVPPPERIGPYRLLRELGRGGMGRVFLAEQETPDYRRTVALKLIHRPGPDLDAVRRFREEVRILAALDHPGIVRFLDGGRSPEGVWFLALEYVEGEDLVAHAEKAGLGVEARAELVAAVADAVEFAHARGVVHRDLKPANILVGVDGRPRLLDFGISKLLHPSGAASLTTTGARPLTPAYASPEQLAGESGTAASDVWSLGVVLYELLTGTRPFASGSEAAVRAPEPPSRRARRDRAARGAIGPDLDAVCLRALDGAPSRRHASAGELAADLRRSLREPARGAAPGRGARRALAAGAAIGVLAIGALVALRSRSGGGGAPAAGSLAEPARGRFPVRIADLPAVEEAERIWAERPDDPVAGAHVALALAGESRSEEADFALARLRQVPGARAATIADYAEGVVAIGRGENQRALVLLTRALDSALAEGAADLTGGIRLSRGSTLMRLGRRDDAHVELERARSELERAGDDALLQRALNNLALEHLRGGDYAEAEAAFEGALAAATRAGSRALVTRYNYASLDLLRGRPDLAETKLREVLDLRREAPNPAREGQATLALASAVRDQGRTVEAAALLERAIEMLRGTDLERTLAYALHERALAEIESARLDGVEAAASEIEAISRARLHRRTLGFARGLRAREAALRGDPAAAREGFAEARRLMLAEGDRDFAALSDLAWAEAEWAAGDAAAATRILVEALAALERPEASSAGFLGETLRARLEVAAGSTAEAERRLSALVGAELSPSFGRRLAYLPARAELAAARGDRAAARADLERAVGLARATDRRVVELELRLALARLGGNRAAAREIGREAEELGLAALAHRASTVLASDAEEKR